MGFLNVSLLLIWKKAIGPHCGKHPRDFYSRDLFSPTDFTCNAVRAANAIPQSTKPVSTPSMAYFSILSVALCLSVASLVSAEPPVQGYNYGASGHHSNGFHRPSTTYLPPKTGLALPSSYLPPNSFTGAGQYANGNHHHSHNHHHGNENEVPKSYEFGYAVKDAQSGNDYDRREMSDGHVVRGEYRVQLPDGRLQIVTYHADWQTGFHANVRYEGEARYPENNNQGYNYNAPQFSGSLNGFNNQGSYKPATAYGPPGYQ